MIPVHEYIGGLFRGHKYHFKCDCLLAMDFIGTVVDIEQDRSEVILVVRTTDNKLVKIGTNHPSLTIEEL